MNRLAVFLVTISIAGCAPVSTTERQTSPQETADSVQVEEVPAELSPVEEKLSWLLGVFNGDAVDTNSLEQHLTAEFISLVGTDVLVDTLVNVSYEGPFGVAELQIDEATSGASAVLVDASGNYYLLLLALEPGSSLVSGMRIQLAPELDPAYESLEAFPEVIEALEGMASETSFLIAEVSESGACVPLIEHRADQSLAVGSAFKLYVLYALEQAVEEGEMSWSDPLSLRADLMSLGGTLPEMSPGTVLTLNELALHMISTSDNSATDHLIEHLGEERVLNALIDSNHHDPHENWPFLSTIDMFTIKLLMTEEEVLQYLEGDSQFRSEQLDGFQPWNPEEALVRAVEWERPRLIEEVEWFATARDLCQIMAQLREPEVAGEADEVMDVMTVNQGMVFQQNEWPLVAYKGGSEPGVLNLTWLAERVDGAWFVLAVTLNDTEAGIDLMDTLAIMKDAFQILLQESR